LRPELSDNQNRQGISGEPVSPEMLSMTTNQAEIMVEQGLKPATAALAVEDASKSFGAVQALKDVSLEFRFGEVTALLGENGAGKSTMIRLCSGEHQPTTGKIFVDGKEQVLPNPLAATHFGIAVVHQEPQLVANMTVAENIFLARLGGSSAAAMHRSGALEREARQLLKDIGLGDAFKDVGAKCSTLSAAERQLVEIARALAAKPKVLFLDEPNSSLTRRETDRLFGIVRLLRDQGVALVLVSHRLGEVYEVSDRVIVMRDGRKVGEGTVAELPKPQAIKLMAGDRLAQQVADDTQVAKAVDPAAPPVLRVRGASGIAFSDVDLDIRAGEIVGMAGLVGSGRTEIVRGIVGADPLFAGTIEINGGPVRLRSLREAVKHGISFISEERRTSVFYGHDIAFNLTSNVLDRFGRLGFFSQSQRMRFAQQHADSVGVKAESVATPIRTLSGGNQQKVLLARALASSPKLLILDEPTRGVDVRTKAEMYALIRKLAYVDGLAVWFVSSEMDEVLHLADRIVVVREGRIVDNIAKGPQAAQVVASALGEKVEDVAAFFDRQEQGTAH
jgi:ABC-type sugar transport system ATPase subunit